jgi:hypothetical protein
MKNILNILGIVVFYLGVIFEIMWYPGSDLLLIISLGLLIPTIFIVNLIHEFKKGESKLLSSLFFFALLLLSHGVLFVLMHWPGFVILLIFSFTFFSVYSLLRSFLKRKDFYDIPFSILYITFLCGMLFKLMHWPGCDAMFLVGMVALIFIVIINVMSISKTGNWKMDVTSMKSFLILSLFVGFLFLNSMRTLPKYTTLHEINFGTEIQNLNEFEISLGNSFITSENREKVLKIDGETAKLIKEIDNIKMSLMAVCGERIDVTMNYDERTIVWRKYDDKKPLLPSTINLLAIQRKFDRDVPTHEIIGSDFIRLDPSKEGYKIWKAYNEYRSKLVELTGSYKKDGVDYSVKTKPINKFNSEEDLDKMVRSMLASSSSSNKINPDDIEFLTNLYKLLTKQELADDLGERDIHWITRNFEGATLMSTLNKLSLLQNEILRARTLAIGYLKYNKSNNIVL